MNIVHLICAILLPPLGVFLKEGVNKNFWIALVLMFFFWLPGVIFAVWRVMQK